MNRIIRIFALASVLATAAAAGTFSQQTNTAGVPVQYRVRLSANVLESPEAVAGSLLEIYGGRIEPFAEEGFRGFLLTTTPERARLLSFDPNVDAVEEVVRERDARQVRSAPAIAAQAQARPKMQTDLAGSWTSGTYLYDGSGNIRSIGLDVYAYDGLERLTTSNITRGGVTGQQAYDYDSFGNLKSVLSNTTPCINGPCSGGAISVDGGTNHLLPAATVKYDEAGNLIRDGGYEYVYDSLAAMTRQSGGGVDRQYLYTPSDERVAIYAGGAWQWTVRDLGGQVLREFTSVASNSAVFPISTNWQWKEDYVYGGGQLLATESSTGRRHFHVDHLGTPRLITDDTGRQVATHTYYPFGAELAIGTTEDPLESHKFTGHERDTLRGDVHTLDYMHARYYSANAGRFLTVDPVAGYLIEPQSLNRYVYVANNPLNATDPTGRERLRKAMPPPKLPPGAVNEAWQKIDAALTKVAGVVVDVGVLFDMVAMLPETGDEPLVEGAAEKLETDVDEVLGRGDSLPDDALVVRGGQNQPQNFENGSGVTRDADGRLQGVSVNSAPGKTVQELSKTIPNGQVGVTTVGQVRQAGGTVSPSRTDDNPDHCTMCGLTPQDASTLFTPTVRNPNKK
jgi:RHS repeat-associated protein